MMRILAVCLVISAGSYTNIIAQNTVTTSGGTINTIPVFTSNTALGNSAITQSDGNTFLQLNGGQVGIGTATVLPLSLSSIVTVGNTAAGTPNSFVDSYVVNTSGQAGIQMSYQGNVRWQLFAWPGVTNTTFCITRYGTGACDFIIDSSDQIGIGMPGSSSPGTSLNISSTVRSGTSAYGLQVAAPTGASANYAASFTGGSVGIGTTSPGASLEVNGNVKLTANSGASITFADGTTQSTAYTGVLCGGDFAESVDVTGRKSEYEPGDVMIADPNYPGKFRKSAEPYSTAVLGVYSTKPGALGRRQTTPRDLNEVPMAMIGIVPTKVSTENGPIRPGDVLVSSSTPGYAMKGTDRNRLTGAVIGKALGRLESGSGVIEVGVTLQ
jgi:hypothetical protein